MLLETRTHKTPELDSWQCEGNKSSVSGLDGRQFKSHNSLLLDTFWVVDQRLGVGYTNLGELSPWHKDGLKLSQITKNEEHFHYQLDVH
jgi:hypothetical protein